VIANPNAMLHNAPLRDFGDANVRFTPNSGHWNLVAKCPLCAKSGNTLIILAAKGHRFWRSVNCRRFKAVALLAARRWHDELVTSAAALSDPRAIAKLQILRQAQSYFG
jgi:hypothetical protein